METARLESEFAVAIQKDYTQLKKGDTAIIRAHGITPAIEKYLKDLGVTVIDATCPNVKDVQLKVQFFSNNGYHIILLGDSTHPEVHGIVGYAQGNITIVKDRTELDSLLLHLPKEVAVLSQTTKDFNILCDVMDLVKERMHDDIGTCAFHNTICPATAAKQRAATELAQEVDICIVVGGKNSSNTRTLVNVMQSFCPTHLVEGAKDINSAWFNGLHKDTVCGITAGSSTPDYSVDEVMRFIEEI